MRSFEERVALLERSVFGPPPRRETPVSAMPVSAWIACTAPGCTRSSYKESPACMACKGWDPRLGDFPPGHPKALLRGPAER